MSEHPIYPSISSLEWPTRKSLCNQSWLLTAKPMNSLIIIQSHDCNNQMISPFNWGSTKVGGLRALKLSLQPGGNEKNKKHRGESQIFCAAHMLLRSWKRWKLLSLLQQCRLPFFNHTSSPPNTCWVGKPPGRVLGPLPFFFFFFAAHCIAQVLCSLCVFICFPRQYSKLTSQCTVSQRIGRKAKVRS